MNLFSFIFQDWKSNKDSQKGRLVMPFFRLANFIFKNKALRYLFFPYLKLYRFITDFVMGINMPPYIEVGEGLALYHGQGLILHPATRIGKNCTLRHTTTIGIKTLADGSHSACPVIGNNVDVGCHSVIIGPITIGDNVVIGAGSVVIKSVPPNCVVAGNPARIISRREMPEEQGMVEAFMAS
ncbi:serine acetyltransferase [Desertivirga arenae]|uniref:serine acetyltransferase n=1 Tax=Desertivirga arenae TaxID=2810309 RepID=UPI001A9718BF|nr:serine acetyltransferase [Pedobacter sp. SYSU D00823]